MSIQQEVYEKEYDIHDWGPNNFGLAVGLSYPNPDRTEIVKFGFTRDDGQESWLDVALTGLKNVGEGRELFAKKEEWKFEGFLWGSGGPCAWRDVRGTYNSRTRTGKLYILVHEQPKPLVEVLSWDEVWERIKEGTSILEMKNRKKGTVSRGYVTRMQSLSREHGNKERPVSFHCDGWYSLHAEGWVGSGIKIICTDIAKGCPIALADGRIQFSLDDFIVRTDCTIYPPDFGIDCPN